MATSERTRHFERVLSSTWSKNHDIGNPSADGTDEDAEDVQDLGTFRIGRSPDCTHEWSESIWPSSKPHTTPNPPTRPSVTSSAVAPEIQGVGLASHVREPGEQSGTSTSWEKTRNADSVPAMYVGQWAYRTDSNSSEVHVPRELAALPSDLNDSVEQRYSV